jgi:hypothetical protein
MIERLDRREIDELGACRPRDDRSAPKSFCVWNRS